MKAKILEKQPQASNFSFYVTDHGELHGAVRGLVAGNASEAPSRS
jgi:hypothetical protein